MRSHTGEIASHFEISRIAVMRHLEVLADAELVTSRKRGRERWHYLNAVPLRRLHERWFDPVASGWASGLLRLQDTVEAKGRPMRAAKPDIDVALDVTIGGTPAAVFSALTEDPGGWWGQPFLGAEATGLTLERRIGGLLLEEWVGGGDVVAAVTGWQDDRHLKLTGPFHLGVAMGVATFDLEPTEGGRSCVLRSGPSGRSTPRSSTHGGRAGGSSWPHDSRRSLRRVRGSG